MASEEDLARIRAAAVELALEGKLREAAGLKAVHDEVAGAKAKAKAKPAAQGKGGDDKGKGKKK